MVSRKFISNEPNDDDDDDDGRSRAAGGCLCDLARRRCGPAPETLLVNFTSSHLLFGKKDNFRCSRATHCCVWKFQFPTDC